ncbi:MAG: hypothetical protein ACRENL_02810 [Candidatus Dormibacteria bacterium]
MSKHTVGLILIALCALSAMLAILRIGQAREPITPGLAAWSVVFAGLEGWGIWWLIS